MRDNQILISKIIEYIEKNIEEDLKLNDIADFAGYSKFHLGRIFAESTGCTIYKYIQKRRLTVAAGKLANTNEAIADIAYEARYESQQAFTFAFRQYYLRTPQQYRESGIYIPKQNRIIELKLRRACLKNHCTNLYAPLCGLKSLNSVNVSHYNSQIQQFHSTKCNAHLGTSIFQTHSSTWRNKEKSFVNYCSNYNVREGVHAA